ncbi:hypothetical protein AB0J14_15715 [Micromonospora arborensis]|uniref:hypothetical protein n=1 Tax=Micromonospora arborensis TaxID=2116518 RepID=UPI0033C43834
MDTTDAGLRFTAVNLVRLLARRGTTALRAALLDGGTQDFRKQAGAARRRRRVPALAHHLRACSATGT